MPHTSNGESKFQGSNIQKCYRVTGNENENAKFVFIGEYILEYWIDLHQTIAKMILGPFYTYRQYISQ